MLIKCASTTAQWLQTGQDFSRFVHILYCINKYIGFLVFNINVFKVVPVTGVFNRGRWECWDYKEGDDTTEIKENDTFITERSTVFVPTSSTATSISAEAMNAVAIDNKIEQAMVILLGCNSMSKHWIVQDLVKTHLTLAVRDEIEHLRAKIVKLETEVCLHAF